MMESQMFEAVLGACLFVMMVVSWIIMPERATTLVEARNLEA